MYMLCHYSSCLTVIDGLIESCLPIPYRLDQKSLAAKDVLCWVGGGRGGEGRWLIPPKKVGCILTSHQSLNILIFILNEGM